jgi:hypothetical protein
VDLDAGRRVETVDDVEAKAGRAARRSTLRADGQ